VAGNTVWSHTTGEHLRHCTDCWLRAIETEMSTGIGHRAESALLTIGDLTF